MCTTYHEHVPLQLYPRQPPLSELTHRRDEFVCASMRLCKQECSSTQHAMRTVVLQAVIETRFIFLNSRQLDVTKNRLLQ